MKAGEEAVQLCLPSVEVERASVRLMGPCERGSGQIERRELTKLSVR